MRFALHSVGEQPYFCPKTVAKYWLEENPQLMAISVTLTGSSARNLLPATLSLQSVRYFIGVIFVRLFTWYANCGSIRLAHAKTESVAFLYGPRHLFDYRYSPTRPKTYIHPLFLPNGVPVTLDGTADHIHHRGLMIAWTDVNGYDFWGETNAGQKGQIVHQRFETLAAGPPATLVAINHWMGGGKVLLTERRTIVAPAPTPENILLTWESELTATETAVVLDAAKAPYDGLGIRFVYGMSGGGVLNSNGTYRPGAGARPACLLVRFLRPVRCRHLRRSCDFRPPRQSAPPHTVRRVQQAAHGLHQRGAHL